VHLAPTPLKYVRNAVLGILRNGGLAPPRPSRRAPALSCRDTVEDLGAPRRHGLGLERPIFPAGDLDVFADVGIEAPRPDRWIGSRSPPENSCAISLHWSAASIRRATPRLPDFPWRMCSFDLIRRRQAEGPPRARRDPAGSRVDHYEELDRPVAVPVSMNSAVHRQRAIDSAAASPLRAAPALASTPALGARAPARPASWRDQ